MANLAVAAQNRMIRKTASVSGVVYLPLYEELEVALGARRASGREFLPEDGLLFKAIFELER